MLLQYGNQGATRWPEFASNARSTGPYYPTFGHPTEPQPGWNGLQPVPTYQHGPDTAPRASNLSFPTELQPVWQDSIQPELSNFFYYALKNASDYQLASDPQLSVNSFQEPEPALTVAPADTYNSPNATSTYDLPHHHDNPAGEVSPPLTSSSHQPELQHFNRTEDGKWQCIWPLAHGACGNVFPRSQELRKHQQRLDHGGPKFSCDQFQCPCGQKKAFRKDAAIRHSRIMHIKLNIPVPAWLEKKVAASEKKVTAASTSKSIRSKRRRV